jgi:hypothetical protein
MLKLAVTRDDLLYKRGCSLGTLKESSLRTHSQDLKIAFEVACARLELCQSNALEDAIKDRLIKHDLPTSQPPLKGDAAKNSASQGHQMPES